MLSQIYAVKVTEENLEEISENAARYNLNVDYLQDTMEFNAEDGFETYAILNVNPIWNEATFTEMTAEGFHSYWQFIDQETTHFERIRKIEKEGA